MFYFHENRNPVPARVKTGARKDRPNRWEFTPVFYLNVNITKMMISVSNHCRVQSKKVYALMQVVEGEKYRKKVQKKKEIDTPGAEDVVDFGNLF